MYVVIAGGGRTGAQLARTLHDQGHEVHVIETRMDVLARIHREMPTELIHEGDAVLPQILSQAGIEKADVVAACTTNDATNLLVCYVAREKFHIKRTIARVNNPRNAPLFGEMFHVDVELNQAGILAKMIQEEMSMGDMMTLLKLRKGNYSLVEEKIPAEAPAVGMAIKDLKLPEHCVIAAIIRHGEVIVPRGVTIFEEGDEVLAITDSDSYKQLAAIFSDPEDRR